MQAEVAILRRLGKVKQSVETAQEYHVRPFVRNSLLTLRSILPHGAGGPFPTTALDRLHGINKGSARTFTMTADYFMRQRMLATDAYKSPQDVRSFQDRCLSHFGNHYNGVNFHSGVWGSPETGGSLKGDEQLALCRLLPFTFLGSEERMQNTGAFRKTFLKHYFNFLKLVAEFGTPQFYTDADMEELGRDIDACVDGFEWCMARASGFVADGEKSELKHGFDTLKVHVFGGAAVAIRRLGSLLCNDTEIGERNMLDLKDQHLNVDCNDKAILMRVNAVRMDAAISGFESFQMPLVPSVTAETEPPPAPVYRSTRSRIASGVQWALFTDSLQLGVHGPFVSEETSEALYQFLREAFDGNFGEFDGQSAANTPDGDVKYLVLKVGVTVQLRSGAYAQILLPRVLGKVRDAAGMLTDLTDRPTACLSLLTPARHATRQGMHPELAVPFLTRGAFQFVSLDEIRRRAHVIPYKGEMYLSPNVAATDHFNVNTLADPHYRVDPDERRVFWQCPLGTCGGREPYQHNGPYTFACPKCPYRFPLV